MKWRRPECRLRGCSGAVSALTESVRCRSPRCRTIGRIGLRVNRRGHYQTRLRGVAPRDTAQISPTITCRLWHRPKDCQARGASFGTCLRARGTPAARRRAGRLSGTSGTRVEHRAVVVPTTKIGNCRGERRRAGWTRRGDLGRHAEMPEDPADHGRLLDERDQAQAAARPGGDRPARQTRRPVLLSA